MLTKTPSVRNDPKQRAALLSALYHAQDKYGWLSPDAINEVADHLNLNPGLVYSTASFYTMFRLKPPGQYSIQICEGLSCYLVDGADTLIEYVAKKLGIQDGDTSPDGKFTLEIVQCLAACDQAPVILINETLYGNLTRDDLDHLLSELS